MGSYKVLDFNEDANFAKFPYFLGRGPDVARFDMQKRPVFEKLIEKQLSFFWRPEEIYLGEDQKQFQDLDGDEKRVFVENLKYQILLDSVQGRAADLAFQRLVGQSDLEMWLKTWAFSETIHSRSYTHIIRNVFARPDRIFDAIAGDANIRMRAADITRHYDALIERQDRMFSRGITREQARRDGRLLSLIYLTLVSVNMLEAIRFYVSFACAFSFAEKLIPSMEGNASIIRLISRDEALHLVGTQEMIRMVSDGSEGEDFARAVEDSRDEAKGIVRDVVRQEMEWAEHLFRSGRGISMLNEANVKQYVLHMAGVRTAAIGFGDMYSKTDNPLPWMSKWLSSDGLQEAPQEKEKTSYLVGQVDSSVDTGALAVEFAGRI